MSVTAMFTCQSKEHDTGNPKQGNVTLTAVTDGSEKAQKFFELTPYGELTLGTLNTAAFDQFEPGCNYLLTIEKID